MTELGTHFENYWRWAIYMENALKILFVDGETILADVMLSRPIEILFWDAAHLSVEQGITNVKELSSFIVNGMIMSKENGSHSFFLADLTIVGVRTLQQHWNWKIYRMHKISIERNRDSRCFDHQLHHIQKRRESWTCKNPLWFQPGMKLDILT